MPKLKNESIERFLKYDCPLGFPTNRLKVYCDFEVGGAYEDWGWVIEYDKRVLVAHKHLEQALKQARSILSTKVKHATNQE